MKLLKAIQETTEAMEGRSTTDDHISKLKEKIQLKINELRNYTPRVGVFGVTGVGKSSLCNALFGEDVAPISDVAACTRKPQELFIKSGSDKGIILIDVPGVGERVERDKEYFELYRNLMPELDLVLWVIKADDRAYTIAEQAYKLILKPHKERCPIVFVINQVDKINPVREWNSESNCPSEKQEHNIRIKVDEISKAFDVSTKYISTVSAEEKYNLTQLMELVTEVLPKEKKYAVVRETNEEFKNEKMEMAGEKGIWDSIKELAGEFWDSVKEHVGEVMIATAGAFISRTASKLTSWIRSWF